MASRFMSVVTGKSRFSLKGMSDCVSRSSNRFTSVYGFSTAYERTEQPGKGTRDWNQGSDSMAETMEPRNGTEEMRNRLNEINRKENRQNQGYNRDDGDKPASDYVTGGVKKATEVAEDIGDSVKETMDKTWHVAKETIRSVGDAVDGGISDSDGGRIQKDESAGEIKSVDQPIDTMEYRSIEELRQKAGGYDKADF